MSRLIRQRDTDEGSGIDLTPMLDVVFIMLIFFIVTASFIKETGMAITRPAATTNNTAQEQKNILLQVTSSNEIWLDGRRIDIRSVRANIERMHAENPKATLIIQADPKTRNDTIVKITDQSREAKVDNISLVITSK